MASRLKLASTKVIRIAILVPEPKNESNFWKLPLQGVDTAVNELSESGISAEYYFFDLLNPETFSDSINRIFESEFHGLITVPLFEEESNILLFQAQRKRMPVVFLDTERDLNLAPEIQKAFQTERPKGIFVTNARSFMLPNLLKANGSVNTRIVGFDLNKENIQYLKSGEIDFLINQKLEHQGYSALKGLYKYLTEDDDSGLTMDIPVEIVVKESVAFYERSHSMILSMPLRLITSLKSAAATW